MTTTEITGTSETPFVGVHSVNADAFVSPFTGLYRESLASPTFALDASHLASCCVRRTEWWLPNVNVGDEFALGVLFGASANAKQAVSDILTQRKIKPFEGVAELEARVPILARVQDWVNRKSALHSNIRF
jgi:hypothetical protein